jgi:hypothetical protein
MAGQAGARQRLGDVVQTLEDPGVAAFDASWDHLGQRLATALGT